MPQASGIARAVGEADADAHMATDASDDIVRGQLDDLETLRRHASELAREADAAERSYELAAWISYAAIFVAIPFVVVLFRLHMQAWHYYVAAALFLAGAFVIPVLDIAAIAKRDKAIDADRRAREAAGVADQDRAEGR